jgi:hypothetical protein
MRALTWEHYCKYLYVLLREELWVDGSLEFENTLDRGEGVVTLSTEGFPDMRGNRPYYVLLLYPTTCLTTEVKVNLIRSSRKLLRTILFVEFARLDTGSLD